MRSHIKKDKQIIWVIIYVNGSQVKSHGNSIQTAYCVLKDCVNIELNFRL